ncbi:MAG: sigma-54-dependent Fis family transcriptional regulator [Acidobacteria bacterium]|nr:sigma-54-dependent Fis family transcriptional regulator [Acidobacteriota bacterium]
MKRRAQVLVVDDEQNVRKVLGALLTQAGYLVASAASGKEALEQVRSQDPDLVICDLKMPGMDGLEVLVEMRAEFPEIPVVLLTAHGTVETAVEAMKRGAHDFLTKPFDRDKILEIVGKAVAQAGRARQEFQGPLAQDERCGLVGASPAMAAVRQMVERVAPSVATVLITGETGTGKELVAEAVHRLSPRQAGPLVRINCGALPETLVEAELFGHERGAFTGADRAKPGRFELAHEGTLFLDEIGELPLPAQVKLLRVLQDGQIDRVGGTQPRRIDVRLVAATNRDLAVMVEQGRFRQDLLYRLRVVEIRVPPLHERREDIPSLVTVFLEKSARRLQRPRPTASPEALAALASRSWPGNVRELENAVERALLFSEGPVLTPADFSLPEAAPSPLPVTPPTDGSASDLKTTTRSVARDAQRRLILAVLEATGGNVTRSAERLGLSRRGLQIKMKEYGLRDAP